MDLVILGLSMENEFPNLLYWFTLFVLFLKYSKISEHLFYFIFICSRAHLSTEDLLGMGAASFSAHFSSGLILRAGGRKPPTASRVQAFKSPSGNYNSQQPLQTVGRDHNAPAQSRKLRLYGSRQILQ